MIKAGIIGAAGYTAGELIRLLLRHPKAELVFVSSKSQAGQPIHHVHKDLLGESELIFQREEIPELDVLFLCLGHGKSKEFLSKTDLSDSLKIIDLSQDFRIETEGNPYLYGLPELQRSKIKQALKVANPGCFATAIQLALLPLAADITAPVNVHAITGSTGAGINPTPTTHFSWRHSNLSVYKAFTHQHLSEIKQGLVKAGASKNTSLNFLPIRGGFSKGIFCTVYTDLSGPEEDFQEIYSRYYSNHPFTWVTSDAISLKDVINTNKCFLKVEVIEGKLLVTSVIDNLLKGASGQAVQNMNLMSGLDEKTGLDLKAIGF